MAKYRIQFQNTSTGLAHSQVIRATSRDVATEKAETDLRNWFNCGGALPTHIKIVAVVEIGLD